jgi:hypothetical protein
MLKEMKKNVTLILSLLFSMALFGQTERLGFSKPKALSVQKSSLSTTVLKSAPLITQKLMQTTVPNREVCKYSYDAKGNMTVKEVYGWNGSSWMPTNKAMFSYDANGNQTMESYYMWDAPNSRWTGNNKVVFAYDNNGNKTLEEYYNSWNASNNTWVGSNKSEHYYSSNNEEIGSAYYSWNSGWVGEGKDVTLLDANNHEIGNMSYAWDAVSKSWINEQKVDYTLNADFNITYASVYSWDAVNQTWVLVAKADDVVFDGNKNMLSYKRYAWNSPNWELAYKEEMTYNANNQQTLSLGSTWDKVNLVWVNSYKSEETYDANNNRTSDAEFEWNGSEWIGQGGKMVWEYDANKNVTLEARYVWEAATKTWIGEWKNERAFDANKNQTMYAWYNWDAVAKSWLAQGKDAYTFDANKNVTSKISYSWNSALPGWVPNYKHEFAFDANGNQTTFISYGWNVNVWSPVEKIEYLFDTNVSANTIAYPNDFNFKYKVTGANYFNQNNSNWVQSNQGVYDYSTGTQKNVAFVIASVNNWDPFMEKLKTTYQDFSINPVICEAGIGTSVAITSSDLVVLSNYVGSGAAGVVELRGISKPMLMMMAHTLKNSSSSWSWVNSSTSGTTTYGDAYMDAKMIVDGASLNHPIFTGITLGADNSLPVNTVSTGVVGNDKGINYANSGTWTMSAGSLTKIATPSTVSTASSIFEITAGSTVTQGVLNTTIPNKFLFVGFSSAAAWNYNADCVKLLMNSCYYLTGLSIPTRVSNVSAAKPSLNIAVENGQIVIAENGPAIIVAVDGRVMNVQAPITVPVSKGIYIVKVGNVATKILVK